MSYSNPESRRQKMNVSISTICLLEASVGSKFNLIFDSAFASEPRGFETKQNRKTNLILGALMS